MRLIALHHDQRGIAGIEFAIIASVLALVFIAVFDLGTGFFRRMQAQSAAQRGAIYASISGFDASGITKTITSAAGTPSATPAPRKFCGCPSQTNVVEVTCSSTCNVAGATVNAGVYVSAGAQTQYTPLLKFIGLPTIMTFQSTQVLRIQ